MTDAATGRSGMSDLSGRIEAASEGSRKLDAEIFCAEHPGYGEGQERVRYAVPHHSDDCVAGTFWRIEFSGKSLQTAPHYTTSIDAALTLVPENHRTRIWDHVSGSCGADVFPANGGTIHRSHAATKALALCAAALRARMAE